MHLPASMDFATLLWSNIGGADDLLYATVIRLLRR